MDRFDVTIVGAGVVGLAIAQQLSAAVSMRGRNTVLLEQEPGFGQHISSRNSEVIHAGIYYPPGSLKALSCLRGRNLLYQHCEKYQVPYRRLGKFIVADQSQGTGQLEKLQHNARQIGVENLTLIDKKSLQLAEPAINAVGALYSPDSGILDSHEFMRSLLQLAQDNEVIYAPNSCFLRAKQEKTGFTVQTRIRQPGAGNWEQYRFHSDLLINCGGLSATAIAANIEGVTAASIPAIYLCKGDYFAYTGKSPFKHLIYPLPEANHTGLGVHATLDLSGQVKFGPDSVLIDHPQWQVDPLKASAFADRIRDYFPAIRAEDLRPDYAGIRPRLSAPGEPAGDFMMQSDEQHQVPGLLQLFGIESPGLTACLALAENVVNWAAQQ